MDPLSAVALATALLRETGLGEFLGRKLGGDAGAAVAEQVLSTAQVVTQTSSPQEALEALRTNADQAHALRLRLLEVHEAGMRAEMEDRASARAMQVAALAQNDLFSKRFVYYFAIGWSLAAVLYFYLATFIEVPEKNLRMADTILGFLLGMVVPVIIAYFYGSSKGSFNKDQGMMTAISALGSRETDRRNPL